MKLLWLVMLLTITFPQSYRVEAKPGFVSRYTMLQSRQCSNVALPPPGQDWAYLRCKGLGSTPIWYRCMDSTRCSYGFGIRSNLSGIFGIDRHNDAWPIEWRGAMRRGHFEPFAVIWRDSLPAGLTDEQPKPFLTIYRLRSDGTSCIIGEESTNADARLMADKSASGYQCKSEPELQTD